MGAGLLDSHWLGLCLPFSWVMPTLVECSSQFPLKTILYILIASHLYTFVIEIFNPFLKYIIDIRPWVSWRLGPCSIHLFISCYQAHWCQVGIHPSLLGILPHHQRWSSSHAIYTFPRQRKKKPSKFFICLHNIGTKIWQALHKKRKL